VLHDFTARYGTGTVHQCAVGGMALIDRGCRFIVSVKYYDYVHPSHCHLDSPLGLAEEHEALRSHASKTVEEFLEMAQQTPVGYPKHFME